MSERTGGFAATHTNDYATAFDRVVEEQQFRRFAKGTRRRTLRTTGSFGRSASRLSVRMGRLVSAVSPTSTATGTVRLCRRKTRGKCGDNGTKCAASGFCRILAKSAVPVAGLTLNVAAMPFRSTATTASVAVVVEARPSAVRLANPDAGFSGTLEIAIVAADTDGKSRGGERGSLTMNLSAAARERVAAQGVRMLSSIDFPPGEYHLSVAAGDGQAKGSVRDHSDGAGLFETTGDEWRCHWVDRNLARPDKRRRRAVEVVARHAPDNGPGTSRGRPTSCGRLWRSDDNYNARIRQASPSRSAQTLVRRCLSSNRY